ncbi:hypothetical protein ANRL4_05566 [Anaerolineae bacterium]|nr:hypothetical protein ANRL4_05566 [Anaerolineae bacterium]
MGVVGEIQRKVNYGASTTLSAKFVLSVVEGQMINQSF